MSLLFEGRTCLVSGGAGFIGSHLVDRLIELGATVVVIDDLSTGLASRINSKAIFYSINILDLLALNQIFKTHEIDYVIHQSAKINLGLESENQLVDVQNSVIATLHLLKCCVENAVKNFVYASSVAVYGRPARIPVVETEAPTPIYSYGIAKKCSEEYVRYFSDNFPLNHAILRYSNVYGPRQPIYGEVGVIAVFVDKLRKREPLTVFGSGEQMRDYIYVDDVVDATVAAMLFGKNETFNVGSGVGSTVNQVLKNFMQLAPRPFEILRKPERTGEIGRFSCQVGKMEKILGVKAKVSLLEGIKCTLDYYCRE